jgi:cysteinyl-tRNA synthetase
MPVEFNDEALESAAAGAKRLKNAVSNVLPYAGSIDVESEEIEEFKRVMNDDLNTSKALAVLFDAANKANKAKDEDDKENAKKYVSVLIKLSGVLGFDFSDKTGEEQLKEKLDSITNEFDFIEDKNASATEIMSKITEVRNRARAEKDWAVADKIRNALDKVQIVLKDTKDGTHWEVK